MERKYTIKEIEEAMRKEFVWSEELMGIEIIKKDTDGNWFNEMFDSFKNKLNNN